MAGHLDRGRAAEEIARDYLTARGLVAVRANYRAPCGELDLVMTHGQELVVVEVRFRAGCRVAGPAETVTAAKRRRLAHTAAHFLQRHRRFAHWPVRFDVVAISGPLGAPAIEWLKAAFTLDDVAGR